MKWPTWAALAFVVVQAAVVAAAFILHSTEFGMLAGLLAPFTLLAVGFAAILRTWKGRNQP